LEGQLEKKVEDDSCLPSQSITTELTTEHCKLVPPDTNRLACTSAAVISFALSLGAHGLLLGANSQRAVAFDPVQGESQPVQGYELAAGASGLEPSLPNPGVNFAEHVVQEGQTLGQIAQLYRVEAAKLASFNEISADSVLRIGQTLKVPVDGLVAAGESSAVYYGLIPTPAGAPSTANVGSTSAKVASAQPSALPQAQNSVKSSAVVQPVAAPQSVSAPDLTTLQQKREALQQELERLKLNHRIEASNANASAVRSSDSQSVVPPAAATAPKTYEVAPGDSLASIARAHGVTYAAMLRVNQLADPDWIFVGQVLNVPASEQANVSVADNSVILASRPNAQLDVQLPTVSKPVVDGAVKPDAVKLETVKSEAVKSEAVKSEAVRSDVVRSEVARVQSSPTLPIVQPGSSTLPRPAFLSRAAAAASDQQLSSVPQQLPASRIRTSYVENLRQEISQLRQKHSGRSSGDVQVSTQPVTRAVAAPVASKAVEAAGGRRVVAVNTQMPTAVGAAGRGGAVPAAVQAKPQGRQVLAANPRPNYDALTQSALGRMVSPELPALGKPDNYLPNGRPQFNGYIWPSKGVMTSPYGWRWGRMHNGIDIAGPIGTPIVAAAAGVVKYADWNDGGYGYMVEIEHPDGSMTRYAHNDRILVKEGQQVSQGQQISEMGSTGYSTGPHLHFEIHLAGQGSVNPMAYLGRESDS
jgi:murein DD-endopeptidase MepM/ murein hydrolase activator NlpD